MFTQYKWGKNVARRGIEGSKKVNGMNTAEEVFNTKKTKVYQDR